MRPRWGRGYWKGMVAEKAGVTRRSWVGRGWWALDSEHRDHELGCRGFGSRLGAASEAAVYGMDCDMRNHDYENRYKT